MQKDTRVLNLVNELRKNMEADWTEKLDSINIWIDLEEFYNEVMRVNERWVANTIFAFIVLAYDASSDYLQITGDRIDNKKQIMKRLAGISYQTKPILVEAILGDSTEDHRGIIDKTIEWYINRQPDWRWREIVSNKEFHSRSLVMAQSAININDMRQAGAMKELAAQLHEKADALLDAIRKEYVDLDSALKKEGKVMITDRLANDHSSWELFILRKNNRDNAAAELEKAAHAEDHADETVDIDDEPF